MKYNNKTWYNDILSNADILLKCMARVYRRDKDYDDQWIIHIWL